MIEKLLQVDIYHPVVPFLHVRLCLLHGTMCATSRSKSVAV